MRRVYTPGQVKAIQEVEGVGQFEAIVSVFGNVDVVGDRVVKGAFANSLKKWEDVRQSGDSGIPVVWTHDWNGLDSIVGEVVEAEERDEGLWVKGQLDMEEEFAQKLFRKLQKRRIREFSFAYDIVNEKEQNGANELLELDIIEVGPTFKGANPDTRLIGVKAGRVLSAKNESKIREAVQMHTAAVKLLSEVLGSISSGEDDDGKAEEPTEAKVEEPAGAKVEELHEAKVEDLHRLQAEIEILAI